MRIEHQPSKLRVAGSSPAGRANSTRLDRLNSFNGGRSSVGRAPDCDSGRRGFESHRPPQCTLAFWSFFWFYAQLIFGPLAQLVEQLTLNQLVVGSSPTRPTILQHPPIPLISPRCCRPPQTILLPISVPGRALSCILVFNVNRLRRAFFAFRSEPYPLARVAELVDALDLGSSGVTRESSSLSFRTTHAVCPET